MLYGFAFKSLSIYRVFFSFFFFLMLSYIIRLTFQDINLKGMSASKTIESVVCFLAGCYIEFNAIQHVRGYTVSI